jgi:hypothetical protein
VAGIQNGHRTSFRNWQTVANSQATNQVTILLNAAVGSMFFRLVYP